MPIKSGFGAWLKPVVAKTANYTVVSTDAGTLFTNTGAAGAVTFTLPTASTLLAGWWIEVHVTADQTVTITTPGPNDTMYAFNDNAADSIAWSTAGQKVGNGATVVCDGTKFIVQLHPATTGGAQTASTVTIAT